MTDKKKIFVIEDDATILYGLIAKLHNAGFEASLNDGSGEIKNVMDQLKIDDPEYIILDLLLPQIDGYELIRQIKGDNDLSHIPIFVFTNINEADAIERCRRLGVEQYFRKTELSIDELAHKIIKIIDNKKKIEIP